MRKPTAVALAFVLVFATMSFAAVPEKVTIGAAKAKQPPVTFDHAKHATKLVKTCETCHHNHKGLTKETKAEVKKCTACHLDTKGSVMPSARRGGRRLRGRSRKVSVRGRGGGSRRGQTSKTPLLGFPRGDGRECKLQRQLEDFIPTPA